jgi:hypothetical protein
LANLGREAVSRNEETWSGVMCGIIGGPPGPPIFLDFFNLNV